MSPPIADGAAVVTREEPRFRACYQHAVESDSTMEGNVQLDVKVAPSGAVSNVEIITADKPLTPPFLACVTGVAQSLSFSKPDPQTEELRRQGFAETPPHVRVWIDFRRQPDDKP